jgi:TetR/AcrR family transcriptional regulator
MPIKQRAIKDDQKQERQQAILATALQLFEQSSYQEITLEAVAERIGLVRGTLYRYFKTREEMFLAVTQQEYQKWHRAMAEGLEKLLAHGTPAIEQVVTLCADELDRHWSLARLSAILGNILEYNIDIDTARQFKRVLAGYSIGTAELLEKSLPFLKKGAGGKLLLQIQALVIGLVHLAEPAPVIRQIFNEPDLKFFKLDFRQEFSNALSLMLYGMEFTADCGVIEPL